MSSQNNYTLCQNSIKCSVLPFLAAASSAPSPTTAPANSASNQQPRANSDPVSRLDLPRRQQMISARDAKMPTLPSSSGVSGRIQHGGPTPSTALPVNAAATPPTSSDAGGVRARTNWGAMSMLAGGTPASTSHLSKEKSQAEKPTSNPQRQAGRLQPVDHRLQSSATSGQQMQGVAPTVTRTGSNSKLEASKVGGSNSAEQEGRIPAVPRMADKLVRKGIIFMRLSTSYLDRQFFLFPWS